MIISLADYQDQYSACFLFLIFVGGFFAFDCQQNKLVKKYQTLSLMQLPPSMSRPQHRLIGYMTSISQWTPNNMNLQSN